MSTNVLLLGRTAIDVEATGAALDRPDVELFAGSTLDDVRRTFVTEHIDMVIMGAGIDLATRLMIVEHVFEARTSTTVHMKDWDSGPQGMIPFVKGIVSGLV